MKGTPMCPMCKLNQSFPLLTTIHLELSIQVCENGHSPIPYLFSQVGVCASWRCLAALGSWTPHRCDQRSGSIRKYVPGT
jgi:hypothetical protein